LNVYRSIDELVGRTPLLALNGLGKELDLQAKIFAKLEYFNPTGSVKDRAAKAMLIEAEKSGKLNKNSVVIEPTSGNTGIALAAFGVARGYKVIIVMPETMSLERQKLMKAYGAELVLTKGEEGMLGAIERAKQLSHEIENSFIPDQFSNFANTQAHRQSTGVEIFEDTDGEVDVFVAGIGTGGTLTGVAEYLKAQKPSVQIVGVEPKSSPFLTQGKGGAHAIQGIGAGFLPPLFCRELCDEVIAVADEDAFAYARLVGKTDGVLAGISSGAALSVAVRFAKRKENVGKTVVALFPDSGERYLSTPLYEK
jgi:cysteine synthase A